MNLFPPKLIYLGTHLNSRTQRNIRDEDCDDDGASFFFFFFQVFSFPLLFLLFFPYSPNFSCFLFLTNYKVAGNRSRQKKWKPTLTAQPNTPAWFWFRWTGLLWHQVNEIWFYMGFDGSIQMVGLEPKKTRSDWPNSTSLNYCFNF